MFSLWIMSGTEYHQNVIFLELLSNKSSTISSGTISSLRLVPLHMSIQV